MMCNIQTATGGELGAAGCVSVQIISRSFSGMHITVYGSTSNFPFKIYFLLQLHVFGLCLSPSLPNSATVPNTRGALTLKY